MSSNNVEFATLRNAGEARAWLADQGCPEHLALRVLEQRSKQPGFTPAQAQPDTDVLAKVRAGGIF